MGVKKVNDWMQPTAKLIAFIVCITAVNSPHYCTPTALQSQNSYFSPFFFLIYSLLVNIIMQTVLAIVKRQKWKMRLVVVVQETFIDVY